MERDIAALAKEKKDWEIKIYGIVHILTGKVDADGNLLVEQRTTGDKSALEISNTAEVLNLAKAPGTYTRQRS